MAGTINTLRVSGMPDSGYPAEIDAGLKVRYVAPLLANTREQSTDFLKLIGGLESFEFDNPKIEWVEDDHWNPRVPHSGLTDGNATTLTVTGAAHRYPVGAILLHVPSGEYARVTGHADANTLNITRDITSSVTEGAWAASDEVILVGFAMHEDDNWVFRPTPVLSMPFNYSQIATAGVQATWRRIATNFYGIPGSDLDYVAVRTVAEQFAALDRAAVHGTRHPGSSTPNAPAMMGGVKFYVTSANGSKVVDLGGKPLTRKDIEDLLEDRYYEVGGDKMARTMVVSAWAKRKIDSFFAAAERLQPGANEAGVVLTRLNTAFGTLDILVHTAVAKDEVLFLNIENHRMGVFRQFGRPQIVELPPSSTGPRVQRVFYADVSMINAAPRAEGRIHNFSLSA